MVSDDITDNSKRNGQCERAIQIDGRKFEQFESEKQDAEEQSQPNADNTAKQTIVTNPMFMGNNKEFFAEAINNDSDSFLSELIINENKSFVSDRLRKDDTVAANTKQPSEIHTNENKGFISDQYKDPDLEIQTVQKKKKKRK